MAAFVNPTLPLRHMERRSRRVLPRCIALSNICPVDADLLAPPVASGGFGDVYFGTLRRCGTPVVLKRARQDAGGNAHALLRHERAVTRKLPRSDEQRWPRFIGDLEWCSRKYVMYERVGEVTLEEYVAARPKGDLARAIGAPNSLIGAKLDFGSFRTIVFQLLTTLQELHGRGLVHRDVKPANIIVMRDNKACPLQLIDFGSASPIRSALFSRPVESVDPLYCAPEIRLHPVAADRFDVFSVALVGLRVLFPSFSGEQHLREFKSRLESVDFDLRRYRDELYPNADTNSIGPVGEIASLLDQSNARAVETFDLLEGMLRKNPTQRISVRSALRQLA